MSPPTINAGDVAAAMRAAISAAMWSGKAAWWVTWRSRTTVVDAISASSSSTAMSSIGSDTNTGPIGGGRAPGRAGASTAGTSLAVAGSAAHLTNGFGTVVASTLVSRQYWFCIFRRWLPAVTISGVLLTNAL